MMGVRGHPEGNTVLSYFATQVEGLAPLDKAMLRAWYSPRAHGGMTPFEMLPIMADELVAISPDKKQAAKARDRFLSRTVEEMQSFADGQGDVPMIVKRCGKSTEQGIRYGRMEMSYFLGVAYLQGVSVAKDGAQAMRWLQRAANLGSRGARAQLGAAPLAGSSEFGFPHGGEAASFAQRGGRPEDPCRRRLAGWTAAHDRRARARRPAGRRGPGGGEGHRHLPHRLLHAVRGRPGRAVSRRAGP